MGLLKWGGALLIILPGGITKLSELEIDVDKDWQGKGITNIKEVAEAMAHGDVPFRGSAIMNTLPALPAAGDAEVEDTYDTANLTGSPYTVIYNRMEFKSVGTLKKVKAKTKTTGDYILRIKSDDGVATHQTHTIVGAAADSWITFTIDDLVVAIGDKYRMEVTRPSGTAYAAEGLYDGTHWKNNKAGFDAGEFDWTNAMGFILLIPGTPHFLQTRGPGRDPWWRTY